MELLQLKYFCDAAEKQNFSKTANKFLVPPSNISQSIKRLETELGEKLFDRHSNKISLNETGLYFYKNIKPALDTIENSKKAIKSSQKTQTIKINIQINRRVVMEVIENFRKKYPQVYFVTAHTADETTEDFDIIISDKDLHLPYQKALVAQEKFLLAYSKKAYTIKKATHNELVNSPFITMSSGSSIHEATLKICSILGFTPRIVLQSEDPFYIRKCIELGLGISFVPEISWRGQFSDDVTLLYIGEYKRNINIYKRPGVNECIDTFYTMLSEAFAR